MRPEREPTPGGGPGAGQKIRLAAESFSPYQPVGDRAEDLFGERPLQRPASAPSQAAAAKVSPTVSYRRAIVLAGFREIGPATDYEVAEHLGWIRDSVGPRRHELVKAGVIVSVGIGRSPSGIRATLWTLASEQVDQEPSVATEGSLTPEWDDLRRPAWMTRRAFDALIQQALDASGGNVQAAFKRVAADLEALR